MTVLVVDTANVMGARADGWWRDRAGAATRLLSELGGLPGRAPESGLAISRVVAVLEGAARAAQVPDGVCAVLAAADGDSEIVRVVEDLAGPVVVVTADRGLRARLPGAVDVWGPRRLLDLLEP